MVVLQSVLVVGRIKLTLGGVFPKYLEILNDLIEFDTVSLGICWSELMI